jgi:hypothetical protein
MVPQHDLAHGHQDEQQREGGDEGVVRQERDGVPGGVVAVLLDHRDEDRGSGVPLLPGVQRSQRPFDGVPHRSPPASSSTVPYPAIDVRQPEGPVRRP